MHELGILSLRLPYRYDKVIQLWKNIVVMVLEESFEEPQVVHNAKRTG